MIRKLKARTADIALDVLAASGPTAAAHKACRAYRQRPSRLTERVALEALNALDKNNLAEIKSAAGL